MAVRGMRPHAPCSDDTTPFVGEGMIPTESRTGQIRRSGSIRRGWTKHRRESVWTPPRTLWAAAPPLDSTGTRAPVDRSVIGAKRRERPYIARLECACLKDLEQLAMKIPDSLTNIESDVPRNRKLEWTTQGAGLHRCQPLPRNVPNKRVQVFRVASVLGIRCPSRDKLMNQQNSTANRSTLCFRHSRSRSGQELVSEHTDPRQCFTGHTQDSCGQKLKTVQTLRPRILGLALGSRVVGLCQRPPERLVSLRFNGDQEGPECVPRMDDQVEIRWLATAGVESDPRFGLRKPVDDGAEVRVTEEGLKNFGRKVPGPESGPCPCSLLRASTVLPLALVLGTCKAAPSLKVLNEFLSFIILSVAKEVD